MSVRHALLAVPPLAVTIGLAVFVGAELWGSHPLTMGEARSVPEAIALGDDAGAARQIEDGAGVNEIGLIRRGILFEHPVLATPLEAAVLVDSAAAFDYLASQGAHVGAEISCLARDIGALAVRKQLTDSPSCPPGSALQAVLNRP